jgi:two-component system sensor histidine kinase AtoS
VALLAVLLTVVLSLRATRPLERLADASLAVKEGELGHQVAVGGPAEVQHVASAFNAMSAHLRETLDTLTRRNALAAVGEYATALSHDVRNALTAIKIDLQRAAKRERRDADADALLRRAVSNVQRLESTVTGSLLVARRGHAAVSDVDLRDVLAAAAETASGAFATLPARLDIDLPGTALLVKGEQGALTQLFANLLFNAAQAVGPGGLARVSLECGDDAVVIAVRDSGPGMTADELRKLDMPFYSSRPNGTGLGLPIARQIASAHGGELWIESERGAGTTVRVRLPLVNGASAGNERGVPAQSAGLA